MSNIYLKVILRKNQNFDFLSLKTSSPGQFLELLKLKNQRSRSKTARWFPIILFFKKKKKKKKKLKSKSPCLLLKKDENFNKKETESKMESPP